jgi:hypothetical protein
MGRGACPVPTTHSKQAGRGADFCLIDRVEAMNV